MQKFLAHSAAKMQKDKFYLRFYSMYLKITLDHSLVLISEQLKVLMMSACIVPSTHSIIGHYLCEGYTMLQQQSQKQS